MLSIVVQHPLYTHDLRFLFMALRPTSFIGFEDSRIQVFLATLIPLIFFNSASSTYFKFPDF
jgi:hypothetical protein